MASGDLLGDLLKIIGVVGVAIGGVWLVIRPGLEKRVMTSAAASQYKLDRSIEGDKAHVALLMDERNEAKAEIAELRGEISEMREQIAEMREQIATTVAQKTEREKQYETLTKQNADIMKNNEALHRENTQLHNENTQLHNENIQLKKQFELMNRKISKLTELLIELKPEYENLLTDTDEFLPVVVNKKT